MTVNSDFDLFKKATEAERLVNLLNSAIRDMADHGARVEIDTFDHQVVSQRYPAPLLKLTVSRSILG